jgi:PAS domain S-box-containing protein
MEKILVVDNNPIVTKFLTNRLEKRGYQVLSADDGLSALNILKSYKPDVIFIDLVMPNISGDKLCQIIRDIPDLKDVFVVIISGIAREQEIDIVRLNADACIAKGPFNRFAENILYVLEQLQTNNRSDLSDKVIGIDDIYERETTKELLYSKKHFEVILCNISDGIIELTPNAKVVYANPAAISLIGLTETQLLGADFIDLFQQEEDCKVIQNLLDTIRETPQTVTESVAVCCNDRRFALKVSPVVDKFSNSLIIIMKNLLNERPIIK